ncbi:MAG: hypothetical protein HC817_16400, partial [Saprospiraceae bacterium]|nr:hypothetical protein [Saprospiraceae bacterium]
AATVKAANGKKDEALALLRQYNIIDDSTTNIAVQKNMNELDARYQTALKDRAIAEQKAALAQRKIFIISLLAVAFLLAGGLLFSRFYYRQNFIRLEKEKEIAALKALAEGEEQERSRLARALHDGLGGLLSAAKLNFGLKNFQPASVHNNDIHWQRVSNF